MVNAILIVDDEPEIRELVANVARAAGFHAICAANGVEAASVLYTRSGIDLVITDLTMPIMDGYQLTRMVRRLYPDIRVICMSGYSDGAPPDVAFLQKPFTVSMIREPSQEAKPLRTGPPDHRIVCTDEAP